MKKYICKLLLAAIIILQIAYTINIFTGEKQGGHGEETLSFQIANGHSVKTYEQGRWVTGKEWKDSITVLRGERFAYGKVYADSAKSLNPPLYYLTLHTICSFFAENFSWRYGLVPGLLCLMGVQVFLFLTVRKITGSEAAALLACLFYGGGKGALCTFTFVSPFCMAAMFCMMFTYASACCMDDIKSKKSVTKKHAVFAACSVFATFLSHYEGIVYIAVFAFLFMAYLICRRYGKAALCYVAGVTAGAVAAVMVNPSMIRQIGAFERPEVTSFSPTVQVRMLLSYLFQYNYGFQIGYFPTAFWNIALPVFAAVLVAAVALLLPFRDEAWFWKLVDRLKGAALAVKKWIGQANYIPFFALMSCACLYEGVAHSVDVLLAGDFAMRFTCIAVAPIAMAAVVACLKIFKGILKKEKAAYGVILFVICGVLIRVHLSTGYPYNLRQMPEEFDLLLETSGKNVLVVGVSPKAMETDSKYFLPELYEAEKVCFTAVPSAGETPGEAVSGASQIDIVMVDVRAFKVEEAAESEGTASGETAASTERTAESGTSAPTEGTTSGETAASTERTAESGTSAPTEGTASGETPAEEFGSRGAELIRRATKDAPWEAVAVKQGENRYYYVLKMK